VPQLKEKEWTEESKDVRKDIRRLPKHASQRLERHIIPVSLPLPSLVDPSVAGGDFSAETSSAKDRRRVDARETGREPKVADLEGSGRGDEDVGGLEVEMKDVSRVDVVETLGSEHVREGRQR
jgi:hypothetical protein